MFIVFTISLLFSIVFHHYIQPDTHVDTICRYFQLFEPLIFHKSLPTFILNIPFDLLKPCFSREFAHNKGTIERVCFFYIRGGWDSKGLSLCYDPEICQKSPHLQMN